MKKIKKALTNNFILIIAITSASCSAPRSMLNSGKVASKNQAKCGRNYTFNISSAPIEQSVKGTYDLYNDFATKDTVQYNQQISDINANFIAYCLDPIGYSTETFFRYGLGHRLDVGFKNSGGGNAFDVMYQFLGSNESFANSTKEGMYGSIGLQYSWEKYSLLNIKMFDKIQRLFGMEMWRKDLTVPLVFSKSFGPEERVGCFSFGVVYSHSFVKYNISTKDIYYASSNANIPPKLLEPISASRNFGAYGSFLNVKIGSKFIYFNFSLAAYYQNYGNYPLLGGGSVSLEGISIVPSYGVMFNIFPKKKKKAGVET